MWDVPLDVHLRLFPLRRSRQRDYAEHTRTDTFRDCLDRAAFSGGVVSLKDNADFCPCVLYPPLQLDQLDMELGEFAFVFLVLQLAVGDSCDFHLCLGHCVLPLRGTPDKPLSSLGAVLRQEKNVPITWLTTPVVGYAISIPAVQHYRLPAAITSRRHFGRSAGTEVYSNILAV
jgi:hypothetical protein